VHTQQEGFQPTQQTGVVLDAATRRSIDFRLEVGALAESVTVSAAVEQVQTASDDVTRVIGSSQLSQIALNGGNYTQLLRLIPRAVATTLDPFGLALSTTGQRINGFRTDSIVLHVDGAENMDNGGNSNAAINPSADAIAELPSVHLQKVPRGRECVADSGEIGGGGRNGERVDAVRLSCVVAARPVVPKD
jgi:hypothetical protein